MSYRLPDPPRYSTPSEELWRPSKRVIQERESSRPSLEPIVTEAVALVELENVDPFDAADWVAFRYDIEDFQAVLEGVRAEVEA